MKFNLSGMQAPYYSKKKSFRKCEKNVDSKLSAIFKLNIFFSHRPHIIKSNIAVNNQVTSQVIFFKTVKSTGDSGTQSSSIAKFVEITEIKEVHHFTVFLVFSRVSLSEFG